MELRRVVMSVFLSLGCCGPSVAQNPPQPVRWSSVAIPNSVVRPGSRLTLELSAAVQDGWHVYGLTQASGGPTPLLVSLEENGTVEALGAPSGTAPLKEHDSSFGLDTEFYTHSFSLRLPAQIKQSAIAGAQAVSISVRFQACNDRKCLPPRTVHLTVPIKVSRGT